MGGGGGVSSYLCVCVCGQVGERVIPTKSEFVFAGGELERRGRFGCKTNRQNYPKTTFNATLKNIQDMKTLLRWKWFMIFDLHAGRWSTTEVGVAYSFIETCRWWLTYLRLGKFPSKLIFKKNCKSRGSIESHFGQSEMAIDASRLRLSQENLSISSSKCRRTIEKKQKSLSMALNKFVFFFG